MNIDIRSNSKENTNPQRRIVNPFEKTVDIETTEDILEQMEQISRLDIDDNNRSPIGIGRQQEINVSNMDTIMQPSVSQNISYMRRSAQSGSDI